MYQNNNLQYIDAVSYDKRGQSSVLEKYVLGLWQPFLKKIIRNLSIGKIVVDLGCGTCEYTQAAETAKKIYAIDISNEMLSVCRKKLKEFSQAEIIQGQAEAFELAEDFADLIITIGIWEYINPENLFETIKKITRRGSKVIVVFPNRYNSIHLMRSIIKKKWIGLRSSLLRDLFKKDFIVLDQASFGMVSWAPKKLQFLALPVWKFGDWLWRPFQKLLPLGVNIYYLFERK